MRKLFIVLAIIFALIGIAFAILPMGTLGVLPTGIAGVFSFLAMIKSIGKDKNLPKGILIIALVTLIIVIARSFVPDEVVKDKQFEQKKIESKKEDLKDLEELEDLE